jgi:hypothetical protein
MMISTDTMSMIGEHPLAANTIVCVGITRYRTSANTGWTV